VEVYIEDMLIKSKEEEDHLDDLKKMLNTLRQYSMKLNPSKCAFGISSGLWCHEVELKQIPKK